MPDLDPETKTPSLGVLFVHGMGSHAPGATLREFGEPLVDWLKNGNVGIESLNLTTAKLSAGDDDTPAHVTCVLTTTAGVRRTWILAEACWSDSFKPPSYARMAFWLIASVPWMLGDYVRGAAMREKRRAWYPWLKWLRWFLIGVYGLLGALLAGPLVLLLTALLGLRIIPIERMRKALDKLPRLLAASLGDVYVILATHVDRAAIRDQIARNHRWLQAACDTTVVVAHSAGSALTHQLLRDERITGVRTYITLGEAIWRMHWMAELSRKGGVRMAAVGLAVVGTLLIAGGLVLIAVAGSAWVAGPAVLAGVGLHISSAWLVWRRSDTASVRAEAIEKLAGTGIDRWRDYVASSDPVPAGALTETAHATSRRGRNRQPKAQTCSFYMPVGLRNRRSIIRDHTSYAANAEGFIAGVGTDLFAVDRAQFARARVHDPQGPDLTFTIHEAQLEPARAARALRTLSLALMRFASALVGSIVMLAVATTDQGLANVGSDFTWLSDAVRWVLPDDSDLDKEVTAGRTGLAAALLLLAGSWLTAGGAWRIWDGRDRARFFARAAPLAAPGPQVAVAGGWLLSSVLAGVGLLWSSDVHGVGWWIVAILALVVGACLLAFVHRVKKARDRMYTTQADAQALGSAPAPHAAAAASPGA